MDPTNKKVIGKFKDEVAGMPIKLTKDDCGAKKKESQLRFDYNGCVTLGVIYD